MIESSGEDATVAAQPVSSGRHGHFSIIICSLSVVIGDPSETPRVGKIRRVGGAPRNDPWGTETAKEDPG